MSRKWKQCAAMDHLGLDELHAEATRRHLLLEQRVKGYGGWNEASEQVQPLWRSVMVDQSALLSQTLAAIKSSHSVRDCLADVPPNEWS